MKKDTKTGTSNKITFGAKTKKGKQKKKFGPKEQKPKASVGQGK